MSKKVVPHLNKKTDEEQLRHIELNKLVLALELKFRNGYGVYVAGIPPKNSLISNPTISNKP